MASSQATPLPDVPLLVEQAVRLPESQRLDLIEQISRTFEQGDKLLDIVEELRTPLRARVPVVRTEGICGGRARVGTTRITVWYLVKARDQLGISEEQLLSGYPTLSRAHLQAAWEYYRDHQAEIDRDIEENSEEKDDEP
jgi:uncharacterized protein (DUF433 family)